MTDTNMQKYRELQLIQLDILKYFDDIAKKNNIPYFLAFGTLLELLEIMVLFHGI